MAMGRSFSSSASGSDHLVHHRVEILVIGGEILDMRLAAIGQQAVRAALAAPVEGDDGKAAAAQFVDHFEIFLDEFGLAVQQQADAARAARCRNGRRAV